MQKKRWLTTMITTAEEERAALPWARGAKRASRKAAARARALAR